MPAVNRERKHNSNPMGKRKHWYLPCIAPALAALLLAGCGARSAPAKALEGCRALLGVREGFLEDRAAELAGSSIGDWLAMALSACGANESYDAYLAALEQHVTERYA